MMKEDIKLKRLYKSEVKKIRAAVLERNNQLEKENKQLRELVNQMMQNLAFPKEEQELRLEACLNKFSELMDDTKKLEKETYAFGDLLLTQLRLSEDSEEFIESHFSPFTELIFENKRIVNEYRQLSVIKIVADNLFKLNNEVEVQAHKV